MQQTDGFSPSVSTSRRRRGSGNRQGFLPGFVVLSFAQGLDVFTTIVGLTLVPELAERNPVAVWWMEASGTVAGLVFLGAILVLLTAIVVELSAMELARLTTSDWLPDVLRVAGYGIVSAVYMLAAFQNAQLIADAFVLETLFDGW